MSTILYIATAIGLFIATQSDGGWKIVGHVLQDKALTSVAVSGETIIAGTKDGVWRSSDNGKSWQASNDRLSIWHVR